MIGFMVPTAFLSMWISNAATAAMMLPIMEAVLLQLKLKSSLRLAGRICGKIYIAFFHLPIFLSISFLSIYSFIYESVIFRTMMLLCIAYSCNVGGTGTIIGNTPRQLHHNRQLAIW